jgi:hypothetical protein
VMLGLAQMREGVHANRIAAMHDALSRNHYRDARISECAARSS